jgi:hypothetical protein
VDIRVKLDDIVSELEMMFDETRSFLNTKTGDIVAISDDEFCAAESEEPVKKFPDWQHENIQIAKEILEEDHFIPLPSKFDVHEYEIMERFCLSLDNEWLSRRMYDSIKGSGAFRRFKENIDRYDIEQLWYGYRDNALKQIAIEWCQENGLKYE